MKSKLNLTIDENLIPLSKAFAREKGTSLSELVESLLREQVQQASPSFADKWRGRFRAVSKDEPRYEHLKARYDL